MMALSNISFFRVTGPLCGEFTGHRRCIPLSNGRLCGFWCFFDVGHHKLLNKQSNDRWFWDYLTLMWCHHNVFRLLYVKRHFHWIRPWVSWRLKSPVTCLIVKQLVQIDIKEIIWALHWLMVLCKGNTPEAVCPHKVPVMRRTFSYHGVFMWHRPTNWRCFKKMIWERLTQLRVFVHFPLIQMSVSVAIMLTSRTNSTKHISITIQIRQKINTGHNSIQYRS